MQPVSFKFVAAGLGQQAKAILYRFKPARTMPPPKWDKGGAEMITQNVPSPYTDKNFWQDRYVLCELHFRREDGKELVVNDAIAAISKHKNIVTTQLVGMDGTVKEYINDSDYSINILVGVQAVKDGLIVDDYPSEGITQLREYFDVKEPIYVYSAFLDLFDISKVVVTDVKVTQDTAANYQPIELSMLSDGEYNVLSTDY